MRTTALIAALLLAGPACAGGFEKAAAQAGNGFFEALEAFKLPAFKPAPPEALAPAAAHDWAALFASGTKPSEEELTGWFAGRRFTKEGPAAALLVGAYVYDNPETGDIDGKSLRLMLLGPDRPKVIPVTFYDELGSEAANTIIQLIRETARQWSPAEFAGQGVLSRRGDSSFELRRSGKYLVCKYPDGGYGYFFKKVR